MDLVVSEGHVLFSGLSKSSPDLKEFIDNVDKLPDGSSLTIQTEGALIPFEFVYPPSYNRFWTADFKPAIDPNKLWGYRFLICHLLIPKPEKTRKCDPIEHKKANAFVSLNLNPTIGKKGNELPYYDFETHQKFYSERIGNDMGELWNKGKDIMDMLLSESRATIIYLYCHGKKNDVHGRAQLELDEDSYIERQTLDNNKVYQNWPIVIINSCCSTAYSPFALSSDFHSSFLNKQALGVVGTILPMPITFAAAFGQKLIDTYVNYEGEPMPIGKVLWNLRRDLLEKSNPLGLFYILDCPLYVTAGRPSRTS